MLKRWDKLTSFLRKPGARRQQCLRTRAQDGDPSSANSLFYRSERGAQTGDMFMSLIHTAELRGENPFDYLTAVLRNEKAAAADPAAWLPWTYRATLASLAERAPVSAAPRSTAG